MLKEAVITLIVNNNVIKTFAINESSNQMLVGRRQECGIYVNDSSVSGNHGRIYLQNGILYYTDLNSTNGTFMDGIRIQGSVTLNNGSVIAISAPNSQIRLSIAFNAETAQPQAIPNPPQVSVPPAMPAAQAAQPQAIPNPPSAAQPPVIPNSEFRIPNSPVIPNSPTGAQKDTLLIGRDTSCDIVLPYQNVSRIHARLLIRNGRYYIENNNSTNGLFVNGARIERGCEITAKDEVHIASIRLQLKDGVLVPDESMAGLSVQVRNLFREVSDGGGKTKKTLLDHITLSIKPNEFVAVIGGSGAGKSTFTNVLCGKTPPSAYNGHVGFNEAAADSRGVYKSVIGYAPQNDILYHDLTLFQMLFYSAKLKMPQDTKPGEYEERVNFVIQRVELTGHENTLVRKLSGGQQKRASIAVELLSDPKLFFLDEPTSGLDPATERKLMRMLKEMTKDNKTIIAVTHVTQNLNLCDKIIVLGKGGMLCFFGTPQNACEYFGVTDIVDVYDKINDNPVMWRQRFLDLRRREGHDIGIEPSGAAVQSTGAGAKKDAKAGYNSGWSQFLVLAARYMRLTFGDPKRCLLLLLQAPILGILLMLVSSGSSDGGVFTYSTSAKSMLFSLTCAAFWVGMLNSIQEICKERDIFAREQMSTVRLLPYIASKVSVISVLCVFQALVLILIVMLFTSLPGNNFGFQPFLGFFITACLTTVSAACLGLAVSSLSPNADRAMAIAPIILLPQILFSGVVFELSGFMKFISNIIPCKLSMQNFGTLSNFNALPTSASVDTKTLNAMYSITNPSNVYGTWRGLIISSIVYIAIFTIALRLKNKE